MEIDDSWILRTLMDNTADSIYIKDRECRIWKISRKMANDLGISDPTTIYGLTDADIFGEEFGQKTMKDDLEVMESGISKEGIVDQYMTKGGELNWTSSTKLPLKNNKGEIVGLMGITREINDLKTVERVYQWRATHDPLTSLPNRAYLIEKMNKAIQVGKQADLKFAVMFIDLNGFKQINDLKGHDQGDRFLIRMAEKLLVNLRSSDLVARYGGDEFVVLLNNISSISAAEKVAGKIANYLSENIDEEEHLVTASIGISYFPLDGEDAGTLINIADRLMYEAKRKNIPIVSRFEEK